MTRTVCTCGGAPYGIGGAEHQPGCAVLGPPVLTREEALADLENVLTLVLETIPAAYRKSAAEQFRANLLALGVAPEELDAAGIKL